MDEQILIKFKQAWDKIKNANNIFLVTHYNPDGDGLSSVCAMIELLKLQEKKFFAYCFDEPPRTFDFLPNLEKINFHSDQPVTDFYKHDLILVFDCGSLSRTKLDKEISEKETGQFVIEFDHHPKIDNYSDLEIRNSRAAATAEIVYYFFKANQIRINKNIANCLLTGILTDTANFLYPATSDATIKISSELLSMGAKLPQITESTLRNKSLEAMKLWGKIMANLQINLNYNFAITALTLEDIDGLDIKNEELEGLSNFLGNLYGVKAVMLLREETKGILKGNLRTADPTIDLSKLAQKLGGGGHTKAAGFSMEGHLEKTEKGWKVI